MKKTVWLLAVLTLMVTIIPLQTMPALLPVDYSIGGEVRRWGSKYSYLILPMVTLLITLLWQFLVAHFERRAVGDDKEAQGAAANAKVLVSVGLVMNLFFCLLQAGLLWSAAWTAEHFGTAGGAQAGASIAQTAQKAMCVLTSVMLIVLGNILPKTRKNRNVGVRLPYSRYNDITWQKSNRFGGHSHGDRRAARHGQCAACALRRTCTRTVHSISAARRYSDHMVFKESVFGRKCGKIKSKRASLFVCDERNKTVLRELIFRAEPFGGRKA